MFSLIVFGLASQVFKELENQVKKYGKACEQNSVKIKSQNWSRMWAGNPELWCCWQASAAQGGNHCIFHILTNLPAGRWDQDWDSLKTENPCAGCNKYTNTQIHKYTNTLAHKYANTQIHKYTCTHGVAVDCNSVESGAFIARSALWSLDKQDFSFQWIIICFKRTQREFSMGPQIGLLNVFHLDLVVLQI